MVGQTVRGQQGRARRHMEVGEEREIEQRLEQGEQAQQRRQNHKLLRGPAPEPDGQKEAHQKQVLEVKKVAGQLLGFLLSREQHADQQSAQIALDAHTIEQLSTEQRQGETRQGEQLGVSGQTQQVNNGAAGRNQQQQPEGAPLGGLAR